MAGNMKCFSLFFFLVSIFCLQPFPRAVGDLTLIKQTCKRARSDPNVKYDFCVAALSSVPASLTADLQGLGVISTKLAVANATDTCSYIKGQLKNNKTMDPPTIGGLKDCFDLYSGAIEDLGDAVHDFESKSYRDANIKLSAGMEAPTTCEEGFEDRVSSPLKDRDANLFQICAIALTITTFLSP